MLQQAAKLGEVLIAVWTAVPEVFVPAVGVLTMLVALERQLVDSVAIHAARAVTGFEVEHHGGDAFEEHPAAAVVAEAWYCLLPVSFEVL